VSTLTPEEVSGVHAHHDQGVHNQWVSMIQVIQGHLKISGCPCIRHNSVSVHNQHNQWVSTISECP
jgi:hypothetical protein